jgi:hypothetical protein
MDSLESRKARGNGFSPEKSTKILSNMKEPTTSSYMSVIGSIPSYLSFPSQLDVDPASSRKDGYTKLFKSKNGYSGYGWDEFYNQDVGVRHRLLLVLYQMTIFPRVLGDVSRSKLDPTLEKLWEEGLIEKGGAQAFEHAFDEHETNVHGLKRRLEERCDSFIAEVNHILASNPPTCESHLYTQLRPSDLSHDSTAIPASKKKTPSGNLVITKEDKFERLELKHASNMGISELVIQRQGDAFKVSDKHGVLPSFLNIDEWNEIMKLPDSSYLTFSSQNKKGETTKKARRIIEDEEEDPSNHTESNLKVVVVEAPRDHKSRDYVEESIDAIKKQLGVDSLGLELSRETLEAEENQTNGTYSYYEKPGVLITNIAQNHNSIEIKQIEDLIMDEREKVQLFRRALRKASDLDEVINVISKPSLFFSYFHLIVTSSTVVRFFIVVGCT